MPRVITAISKILTRDQDRALADGVRQLPGVSGEQQRWQHEDGAGQRQILAALIGLRDDMHRAQRDDNAVSVIVERAQELRPEEGQEAAVFQYVFESAVCHALLLMHGARRRRRRRKDTTGQWVRGRLTEASRPGMYIVCTCLHIKWMTGRNRG